MKLKKILALLLAAMMVLGMTGAMAAIGNDTPANGTTAAAETGVQEGNATAVTINTVVVVTNNETTAASGKTINYPAFTFKYTVAPASVAAGTTVADADDEPNYHTGSDAKQVKVQVKEGVAGGITVTGGTKTAGTVVLNAKGQEAVLVPTTFTGNISAFTNYGAGIYRYAITDASTTDDTNLAALENAGVVKGAGVDQDYFLDVYVKNGTSGLEFGGFVLMSENPGSIDKENDTNIDKKKSGFDEVDLINDGTSTEAKLDPTKTADLTKNYSYTTYNVTLKKTVAGGLGDRKHGFPFVVAVGVQSSHPTLNYDYEVTGSANTANDINLLSNSTIPATVYMSDGSLLKIWGLSPFATVNYTETNDTDSAYQVKVGKTAGTADIRAQVEKAKNETLAAWDAVQNVANGYAIGTTANINNDADEVHFTNTLNDISPTGVVLRFAPYIAMLVAGTALFLILLAKRREEDKEEN